MIGCLLRNGAVPAGEGKVRLGWDVWSKDHHRVLLCGRGGCRLRGAQQVAKTWRRPHPALNQHACLHWCESHVDNEFNFSMHSLEWEALRGYRYGKIVCTCCVSHRTLAQHWMYQCPLSV